MRDAVVWILLGLLPTIGFTVVALSALLARAPASKDDVQPPSVGFPPDATMHDEQAPGDPWTLRPAKAPEGAIDHCGPWVRGAYESIQVNVDHRGCNIVGDAANEPSIAIDPTDPRKIVIGWRQFDTIESNFRQAGYAYSRDAGHTWTFPGVLAPGLFRSDPVLDADHNGTIYYIGVGLRSLERVFKSYDGGVSWHETPEIRIGDKPWITVDRSGGIGRPPSWPQT